MTPVFEALVAAYPEHLREEQFNLEAFLWAAQLWYAYAIQVRAGLGPGDGGAGEGLSAGGED
jgi:hypothetical protein